MLAPEPGQTDRWFMWVPAAEWHGARRPSTPADGIPVDFQDTVQVTVFEFFHQTTTQRQALWWAGGE